MTYAELMQLLADVRAAIQAQRGPFTYSALNEQLAKLTAPAWMRYILRVIDVMVTTGELTRDIAVNGGPHRYASGKRGVEATAAALEATVAALEAAFIYDLTDRTPPATRVTKPIGPAPITLAASSTRSPPKTPPPAAARAVAMPAGAASKTDPAPPSPRPPAALAPSLPAKAAPRRATPAASAPAAQTLRQRVLDVLAKQPTPTAQIIRTIKADCPRLPDSSVGATLTTLKNEGLTVPPEERGGAWRLKSADRPAGRASAPAAVRSPAKSPDTGDRPDIEVALADLNDRLTAALNAYQRLQQLVRPARSIVAGASTITGEAA